MKKLLQLVALLLTLSTSAQPILADTACAQRACGSHPTMGCCPQANTTSAAMPSGMRCGRSQPIAAASIRCMGDSCCVVSAAILPALPSPRVLVAVATGVAILSASSWIPFTLSAIKAPPIPRLLLPTPRYILFRDFRI